MLTDSHESVGDSLDDLIRRTGRKLNFVAAAVGVSEETLKRWRHGATEPVSSEIERLACVLDADVSEIVAACRVARSNRIARSHLEAAR